MNDVKNAKHQKRKEYETEFCLQDTDTLTEEKKMYHAEIRKKEDENHILAVKLDDISEKRMCHSFSSHEKKKEIHKEIETYTKQIHRNTKQIDDLLERTGILESIIIERKLNEK